MHDMRCTSSTLVGNTSDLTFPLIKKGGPGICKMRGCYELLAVKKRFVGRNESLTVPQNQIGAI